MVALICTADIACRRQYWRRDLPSRQVSPPRRLRGSEPIRLPSNPMHVEVSEPTRPPDTGKWQNQGDIEAATDCENPICQRQLIASAARSQTDGAAKAGALRYLYCGSSSAISRQPSTTSTTGETTGTEAWPPTLDDYRNWSHIRPTRRTVREKAPGRAAKSVEFAGTDASPEREPHAFHWAFCRSGLKTSRWARGFSALVKSAQATISYARCSSLGWLGTIRLAVRSDLASDQRTARAGDDRIAEGSARLFRK